MMKSSFDNGLEVTVGLLFIKVVGVRGFVRPLFVSHEGRSKIWKKYEKRMKERRWKGNRNAIYARGMRMLCNSIERRHD